MSTLTLSEAETKVPSLPISKALLIIILGLLTAFGPLSIDMYLPALPAIGQSLHSPMVYVQQTLSVYFIGMAFGQLIYGPLSDRWGRKGPLLGGLVLYFLTSIGCALAPSIGVLIGMRWFQALGGCAGVVIARAVTRDYFSPRDMAKVMSLLMLVMGLAPILAPMMGGLLLEWVSPDWGWRLIFGILALLGALSMAMVFFFLPESLPSEARSGSQTWSDMLKGYRLIFKDRYFLRYTLTGGLAQAALFAYISASSVVFIEYFHLSPLHYSWLFGLNACGIIGGAQINALLLKHYHPETVMTGALWGLMLGSLALGLTAFGFTNLKMGFWPVAIILWSLLTCLGFIFPNSAALALTYQKKAAGSASAVMGVIQYLLGALSALAVSVLLNWMGGHPLALASLLILCSGLGCLIDRWGLRQRRV